MKRVLVIGCAGSGKTTLSKKLAEKYNLPAIHLDRLFWKPNWIQRPKDEFDELLQIELEKEFWIMDGNYTRTFAHRLKYADGIVLLDFHRWICVKRALKRYIFDKEDQAQACPQKIDFDFLKYILWNFPTQNRPYIQHILEKKS